MRAIIDNSLHAILITAVVGVVKGNPNQKSQNQCDLGEVAGR